MDTALRVWIDEDRHLCPLNTAWNAKCQKYQKYIFFIIYVHFFFFFFFAFSAFLRHATLVENLWDHVPHTDAAFQKYLGSQVQFYLFYFLFFLCDKQL